MEGLTKINNANPLDWDNYELLRNGYECNSIRFPSLNQFLLRVPALLRELLSEDDRLNNGDELNSLIDFFTRQVEIVATALVNKKFYINFDVHQRAFSIQFPYAFCAQVKSAPSFMEANYHKFPARYERKYHYFAKESYHRTGEPYVRENLYEDRYDFNALNQYIPLDDEKGVYILEHGKLYCILREDEETPDINSAEAWKGPLPISGIVYYLDPLAEVDSDDE